MCLHSCVDLSLVAVLWLLVAVAFPLMEHGLSGLRATVAVTPGL